MVKEAKGLSWKGYEGQDYEQFWTGPGKKFLDELERKIASKTLPGGEAVVEIGAGFGRLGSCYVGKYARSTMVEPASNLREIATRTYASAVNYVDASVYDLPFPDASHDAALMVRVFHHLGEPRKALAQIHRILKPGGRLVFNYSNKRNIKRILKYCVGAASNPFTLDPENYYDALIGHHPRDVEKMLWDTGFEIREQYGVGITDKCVEAMPFLASVVRPSVFRARMMGWWRLAPAQFVVGVRK